MAMRNHTNRGTIARLLRDVADDNRGLSVIELALVAPVLLLLLLGMVDTARIVAARLDLEQAAQRTTDYALAKRPRNADGTYLVNEAATAARVPAANVTVDIFLKCNGNRQVSFDTICPTGEKRARYVSVSVRNTVQTMFNWASLATALGYNGLSASVTVTGDSLVRFQ